MNAKLRPTLLAGFSGLASLLTPLSVLAHPGHSHGEFSSSFMHAFAHPFTGTDHLLAMLAVGVWSAVALRSKPWAGPLAFMLTMLVGALVGSAGMLVPGVEVMIAASLLVMGLLLATRTKLPVAAGAAMVGGFAFFHGAAHGYELDGGAAALLAMVLATGLLHVTGMALGQFLIARRPLLGRVAGAGVAAVGSALLLGLA